MSARWTQDVPTELPTADHGEGDRRRAPLDAHLIAWVLGLALAALIVLAFGDALAGWAGLR